MAILNANYIAKRLAPHYPILYAGEGGLVAQLRLPLAYGATTS